MLISFSNELSSLTGLADDGTFRINEKLVCGVFFDHTVTVARNIGLANESFDLAADLMVKLTIYDEKVLPLRNENIVQCSKR